MANGSSGFKSFSDLLRENGGRDDDEERNTFAGGETSGLEIQDPKKERERLMRQMMQQQQSQSGDASDENGTKALLQQLMEKAQRNGAAPADDSDSSLEEDNFLGQGQRLGSNLDPSGGIGAISSQTEHPQSIIKARPSKVSREITFWADGFTLGHDPTGKLYKYDDAANAHYLKELDQGRAPLSLLDVELGQRVDVTVKKNTDQKYVPPKRVGGFGGQGARLGSEIPSEVLDMVETKTEAASLKPLSEDELARKQPNEQGETKLQIRYANGTKEVYKVALTTTIGELYAYVKQGGKFGVPAQKPFTVNHVFPLKPITDMDRTLEDEGLKNASVVQRWVV